MLDLTILVSASIQLTWRVCADWKFPTRFRSKHIRQTGCNEGHPIVFLSSASKVSIAEGGMKSVAAPIAYDDLRRMVTKPALVPTSIVEDGPNANALTLAPTSTSCKRSWLSRSQTRMVPLWLPEAITVRPSH